MILFFELFLKIYYKLSNITYIFRKVIKFQESWSVCLQDYLRFSMLCVISKVSNEVMFRQRGSPILEEARRTVKKFDETILVFELWRFYRYFQDIWVKIIIFFTYLCFSVRSNDTMKKPQKKFSHYSINMMVFQ